MHRNDEREAVHVTDKPVEEGQAVTATIDWERRLDHMQQHTGQACYHFLHLDSCHNCERNPCSACAPFLRKVHCAERAMLQQ